MIGDLRVHPLCLGGNVFGWTADERQSFEVLDAYADAGGNFVDTADVYSNWVPGHTGGESETIIGRWMAARGNRDRIVVATKVGMLDGLKTLDAKTIRAAAEASLRRLGTDRIDLYYAHQDDQTTALQDTFTAFDELVREGKVRHVGVSNYSAPRLAEALAVSSNIVALQPHYNLVERSHYEGELQKTVADHGLACVPYFGLARGFLTGKYRLGGTASGSPRAARASSYLDDPRGARVLAELDAIAQAHDTTVAAVALAWLAAQPTVVAPIASARNMAQLSEILPFAELTLAPDELDRLSRV